MNPANPAIPAHRTRATRLRAVEAKGEQLDPADALWLANYTDAQKGKGGRKKRQSFGASQSKRTIEFKLDEQAQAVGTGDAAREAAAAALVAREEGRRIDLLSTGAVAALKEAVSTYESITKMLTERLKVTESTQIEMLKSMRDAMVSKVEAEIELMHALRERDEAEESGRGGPRGVDGLLAMALARHLGIDVTAGIPGAGPGKRPPPNGRPT